MLKEMNLGKEELNVMVVKIQEKKMKNGNPYSLVTISDGETLVDAKVWSSNTELSFKVHDVIKVVLEKQEYNGQDSYIIHESTVTNEDYKKYLIHAPINEDEYYNFIIDTINGFKDENIKKITLKLLDEKKNLFLTHPAAKAIHHNYLNGLLYHTGRMLKCAIALSNVYDSIDKDVLYAGVILHDIGKIEEMRVLEDGNIVYSSEGNLLGHPLICIEWINEIASELGVKDNNKLFHLKHLIASHHGELEYGAIAKPATKEAMLLHEIDMIDASFWQYENIESNLEVGCMSDKVFGLGSVVYKPDRN